MGTEDTDTDNLRKKPRLVEGVVIERGGRILELAPSVSVEEEDDNNTVPELVDQKNGNHNHVLLPPFSTSSNSLLSSLELTSTFEPIFTFTGTVVNNEGSIEASTF